MKLLEGDCVELMRGLDEASIDAVVCDPPYGLEFMGKEWDRLGDVRQVGDSTFKEVSAYGAKVRHGGAASYGVDPAKAGRAQEDWHRAWATEALRVLRPGGHLLAFGGTRTYHRLACAVEDAGFEIRDSLIWLYGSGFPKSLDVSKAIDKAAGVEREDVYEDKPREMDNEVYGKGLGVGVLQRNPATPEAQQWQGWGTALKPSHEPVVVARKPLSGTVAANVLAHGTGALNVDGCRVGTDGGTTRSHQADYGESGWRTGHGIESVDAGRWPSNVILSPDSAAELDEQSGERASGWKDDHYTPPQEGDVYDGGWNKGGAHYGDTGGASRFFYTAKASRGERNAGLEGFKEQDGRTMDGGHIVSEGRTAPKVGGPRANHHPTVKPIDLMRWLCRLVTPPGGTVLDPFTGSGTTGIAAHLEGFDFIGCEREAEYAAIAKARIEWWSQFPVGTEVARALKVAAADRAASESGQGSLI